MFVNSKGYFRFV